MKSTKVNLTLAQSLAADQKKNDAHVERLMAPLKRMLGAKEGRGVVSIRNGEGMTMEKFRNRVAETAKSMRVALRKNIADTTSVPNRVLASMDDITLQFGDEAKLREFSGIMAGCRSQQDSVAYENKQIIAAFVTTVVYNYITATSRWADFFRQVNLANDEMPELTIDPGTKQKLRVRSIGIDGGFELVQPNRQGGLSRIFPDIQRIVTDDYEYPIYEPCRGDVRQEFINLVDHAMAIADAINDALAAAIQTSSMPSSPYVASFVTTGPEADRHYLTDPRVNVNNLPTGNYIVLPANTSTSTIRQAFLTEIIKYAGKWGTFSDGTSLSVEAVHIASADAFGWLDQVNFITTMGTNPVIDQIFNGGQVMSYANQSFNWIADNTIDPSLGIAYVRFNRPIGELYRKPGMDQMFHDTSVALQKENKERMAMASHFGIAMPLQWNPFTLAIKYRS